MGTVAEVGGDEIVYFAVEDGLGVGGLVVGAVVLDHLVGLEDVGADLVAPGDFAFFAVEFGDFVVAFLLFESFDFGLEEGEGDGAVLMLGAFGDTIDDDAGG